MYLRASVSCKCGSVECMGMCVCATLTLKQKSAGMQSEEVLPPRPTLTSDHCTASEHQPATQTPPRISNFFGYILSINMFK